MLVSLQAKLPGSGVQFPRRHAPAATMGNPLCGLLAQVCRQDVYIIALCSQQACMAVVDTGGQVDVDTRGFSLAFAWHALYY